MTNKEGKAIHWSVFLGIAMVREESVFGVDVKTGTQLLASVKEFLFFKDLVRNHGELKVEEVAWL